MFGSSATCRPVPRRRRRPSSISTIVAVLYFSSTFTPTNAKLSYLSQPKVLYSATKSTQPTTKNNVIYPSPDGTTLFVTSSDGTLTTLDAASGQQSSIGYSIQPRPRREGWTTESTSGISLHEDATGGSNGRGSYFIFAVVDIPPAANNNGGGEQVSSRIFAVDYPMTKSLRWVSSIPGRITGTPLIDSSGLYIYFVHNEESKDGGGSDVVGHFSVAADGLDGEIIYTERSPTYQPGNDDIFAPLGIAHNPIMGNYAGGEGNTNDLLLWGSLASSRGGLLGRSGHTYAFQLPKDFRKGTYNTQDFAVVTLNDYSWVTNSAPALSESGFNLYFGISSARMRGWVMKSFDKIPSWRTNLDNDDAKDEDTLLPPPNSPTLSRNEKSLFVASTSPILYALDAENNGNVLWQDGDIDSVVHSKSVVSPDDDKVYYVDSSGRAYSADIGDGEKYWDIEVEGEISADMALSRDGTFLYTVSTEGDVTGIQVAESDESPTTRPTRRPTLLTTKPSPTPMRTPTTPSPTLNPSRRPTAGTAPRPTRLIPTYEPTNEPTLEAQPSPSPTSPPTLGFETFGLPPNDAWSKRITSTYVAAFVVPIILLLWAV